MRFKFEFWSTLICSFSECRFTQPVFCKRFVETSWNSLSGIRANNIQQLLSDVKQASWKHVIQSIQLGQNDIVVVGGMESMFNVSQYAVMPHVVNSEKAAEVSV